MIFNLFSFSVYSAVSVLWTNKLVQNISICNPSVIFVSNHCYTTIFMYPHFLVLQLSSISNQLINLQSINFQKKNLFVSFPYHLLLVLCTPFVLSFNPFHALTPAGATVVHKSNSFNPELKCRLRFLSGCIRSR